MVSVLLVDPDAFVRALLCALLAVLGHVTLQVDSDEAALEVLTTHSDPLVVVLSSRARPADGLLLLQAVATDARLRERHGYLLLGKDAAWLPQSFQLLHELLTLRRLEPSGFGRLGQTIADMAAELQDRQRGKTEADRQPPAANTLS